MQNFRQQYKKQKQDLLRRHEESVANKSSSNFGIIDSSKLPDGIGFWKCTPGQHIIDYIVFKTGPNMPKVFEGNPQANPFEEGQFAWSVDLWVHKGVGVLEQMFVCPAKTNGLPCPICEDLSTNRDSYTKDEYNAKKTKRNTIHLIWCHDNSDEEGKGIQIWQIPFFFMENHMKRISEKPKGGGTVPYYDPDIGKQVVFDNESTAANWSYLGHKFNDREEEIPDKILDQSFALDSAIKYNSYDEIYEAYYGASDNEETDTGNEDMPVELTLEQDQPPVPEFTEDECPVGGEFGVDHNELEFCEAGEGCPNWDDCFAAKQEMNPEPEPDPPPVSEPEPPKRKPATDTGTRSAPIRRRIKRK